MTYPSGSGVNSNQWGPWQPASSGGTPPPTGALVVPQSPSGSVTGMSATFNLTHTITSTEQELTDVLGVDSAQQGAPALNAPISCNGGINPAAVQTFRWE